MTIPSAEFTGFGAASRFEAGERWSWSGTAVLPAAYFADGVSELNRTLTAVLLYPNGRVYFDLGDQDATHLLAAVRTNLQVTMTVGSTSATAHPFGGGDATDPYDWTPANAADFAALYNATSAGNALALSFEERANTPVNANPGNAAGVVGSASLDAHAHGPLPNDADPGQAAGAAGSASLSAEPHELPVFADPGNAAGAAGSASLDAEPLSATPVEANPGEATGVVGSASLTLRKGNAAVNADPGQAAGAAGSASLSVELSGQEVDADPGAAAGRAGSASLSADIGDLAIDLALAAAGARGSASLAASIFDYGTLGREAAIALSTPARIVTCIEITHPDADGPIRLVDDGEDLTVGGVTYLAARFEAQSVGDGGQRAPRGQLLIGNAGRQVSQWIDEAGGGAGGQVRVMDVLVDGNLVAIDWELTMDVASITTGENVQLGLGFDPLLGRPAVAMRYDPQTAPGLF